MLISSIPTLDSVPGSRLVTKEDFLNGTCSSFRRWVFEPNQKTNNVKNMVEDGHFVSSIFMQEVVAC